MSAVYMPFGKHKGKQLSELPFGYLHWLTTIDTNPWLRQAVQDELRRRHGSPPNGRENQPPATPWRPAVDRWYRDLVMRHHPDRGGNLQVMQAINDARDRLVKLFESAV